MNKSGSWGTLNIKNDNKYKKNSKYRCTYINLTSLVSPSKCVSLPDTGFVMVQGTTYWTDLFVRHFLFQTDRSTDADDLLFFIRKKQLKGSRYIPKYQVGFV